STNLTDVRVVPTIAGQLSLPSTINVNVDSVVSTANVTVNGATNGQVGLAINSNIVSTGTITKTGTGVLQLGGVSYTNNSVNFLASGRTIVLGQSSNYAGMTTDTTNGVLDMRGQSNLQVGTVSGSGTIKNFSPINSGVLVTGDATGGTFSGTFTSDYTS